MAPFATPSGGIRRATSVDESIVITRPTGPTADFSAIGAGEIVIGQVSFGGGVPGTDDVFPVQEGGFSAYMAPYLNTDTALNLVPLESQPRYGFAVPHDLSSVKLLVMITELSATAPVGQLCGVGGVIAVDGVLNAGLEWGLVYTTGGSDYNVVQERELAMFVARGQHLSVTMGTYAAQVTCNTQVQIVIVGRRAAPLAPPVDMHIWWKTTDVDVVDGLVANFRDQSGFANDAGQPTVGRRLALAETIGGIPAMLWPAPVDPGPFYENADVSLGNTDYTIATVLRPTTAEGGIIMRKGAGDAALQYADAIWNAFSGFQTTQFDPYGTIAARIQPAVNYAGINILLVCRIAPDGSVRVWVNNVELTVVQDAVMTENSFVGCILGNRRSATGTPDWSMYAAFAELIRWPVALSDADIAAIWTYAERRYGL